MKKINLLLGILILLTVSCTKTGNQKATVVTNCTGMYLSYHGKSYFVCNEEILSGYSHGDQITAKFKKIGECNRDMTGKVTCFMMYKSHGTIEILKIK